MPLPSDEELRARRFRLLAYLSQCDIIPSYREIGEELGEPYYTVQHDMEQLQRLGYVEHNLREARAVKLLVRATYLPVSRKGER
jgi:DNA-binding transcriptional regulator YhcF (GntR family)